MRIAPILLTASALLVGGCVSAPAGPDPGPVAGIFQPLDSGPAAPDARATLEPTAASPQPPGYRGYPTPPPRQQVRTEPPRGWVTMGFHWVTEEGEVGDYLDDSLAFSFGIGGYLLRHRQIGLGPEFESIFSYHRADLGNGVSDDVYVSRILLGARFAYFIRDTNLAPYVRGGWIYRWDDGWYYVRDDGGGYYLGGGLDVMINPHFSIVPQILYTNTSLSVDAEEYLFGVNFDFKF